MKRKLIEVALPLETINRESAREKSIRHGHPFTLHLWWARRPLAAARAVLVRPARRRPFLAPRGVPHRGGPAPRTRTAARHHRAPRRLGEHPRRAAACRGAAARSEVLSTATRRRSSTRSPAAARSRWRPNGSGLEAHASDLNPVAVLINKALIEIPPKFRDRPPVFPGLADSEVRTWTGAEGLAADVRAYGDWMRDEAEKRIGHLYPKATLPDGFDRQRRSPGSGLAQSRAQTRPAESRCRWSSWWLGKKKGKEAYVVPIRRRETPAIHRGVESDLRFDETRLGPQI